MAAEDERGSLGKKLFTPTVEEIVRDRLTQLSLQYWAGGADQKPFDPQVVEDIYAQELTVPLASQRIMLLELSHYLEAYATIFSPTRRTAVLLKHAFLFLLLHMSNKTVICGLTSMQTKLLWRMCCPSW